MAPPCTTQLNKTSIVRMGEVTDMQVTAEIRWFWQDAGPPRLKEWFTGTRFHPVAAGGGDFRTDTYLRDPQQAELGIKLRGNQPGVEVKGLVAVLDGACSDVPFTGSIEMWGKWTSARLGLPNAEVLAVGKRRWVRRFATGGAQVREIALDVAEELPAEGCNVEYTEISVEGFPSWVTLGFELFGPFETIVPGLRRAVAEVSRRRPPALADAWCASYPVWLQRFG